MREEVFTLGWSTSTDLPLWEHIFPRYNTPYRQISHFHKTSACLLYFHIFIKLICATSDLKCSHGCQTNFLFLYNNLKITKKVKSQFYSKAISDSPGNNLGNVSPHRTYSIEKMNFITLSVHLLDLKTWWPNFPKTDFFAFVTSISQ